MPILRITFTNVTSENYDTLIDAVNVENMSFSLTCIGNQTYTLIFDQAGHGERVKRIVGEVAIFTSIIIQTQMLEC